MPRFFNYKDGGVPQAEKSLLKKLNALMQLVRPKLILTFNQADGITGHPDHKTVGKLVDEAAVNARLGDGVYHMALSPRAFNRFNWAFSETFHDSWKDMKSVPMDDIHVRVNISPVRKQKMQGIGAHQTQFPHELSSFQSYNYLHPFEEFTHFTESEAALKFPPNHLRQSQ